MEIQYKLKSYNTLNDYILLKVDNKNKIKIFDIEYDKEVLLKYLEKEFSYDIYKDIEKCINNKKDIYLVTNKYETKNLLRKMN